MLHRLLLNPNARYSIHKVLKHFYFLSQLSPVYIAISCYLTLIKIAHFLPSLSPQKCFLISPTSSTCTVQLIFPNLTVLIIFGGEHKLRILSTSVYLFSPSLLSVLVSNIPLSTLSLNTLCSFLNIKDKVWAKPEATTFVYEFSSKSLNLELQTWKLGRFKVMLHSFSKEFWRCEGVILNLALSHIMDGRITCQ